MDQSWTNRTNLDGAPWSAWMSWAEGPISVLRDYKRLMSITINGHCDRITTPACQEIKQQGRSKQRPIDGFTIDIKTLIAMRPMKLKNRL